MKTLNRLITSLTLIATYGVAFNYLPVDIWAIVAKYGVGIMLAVVLALNMGDKNND